MYYCPQVCFFDVSASEGEKAQKGFDEKYGSGKAVFLKCDVSKKIELHGNFTNVYFAYVGKTSGESNLVNADDAGSRLGLAKIRTLIFSCFESNM